MIRWDNILTVILVILVIHAVQQIFAVAAIHGQGLQNLYERVFRPELRAVFWLEVLVLAIVIIARVRGRCRRKGRWKGTRSSTSVAAGVAR